ncbi:ATP-binding protein [Actinomadura rupiterrae]|uniref:ATP-binding protein n=1 Tax=Actinomadura rupiterrae TaxID=559627 RepID=UPI0020A3E5E9|nr:ATP-binding protein [Actinomadura rupiterrae]MCP2335967.1 anti-sigma regulatory factor (Ser/Thr protein kinase) [Actinomadura rupiterrae]
MNVQTMAPGHPEIRMTLLATPGSVVLARELVRYALVSWGFGKAAIEDATLVMSEIVTNALNVAAGDEVRVRVAIYESAPLLECWDPSPTLPEQRNASPDAESGRGLLIVAAYAKDTGVRPSANGKGKVVWALMPAHP